MTWHYQRQGDCSHQNNTGFIQNQLTYIFLTSNLLWIFGHTIVWVQHQWSSFVLPTNGHYRISLKDMCVYIMPNVASNVQAQEVQILFKVTITSKVKKTDDEFEI